MEKKLTLTIEDGDKLFDDISDDEIANALDEVLGVVRQGGKATLILEFTPSEGDQE